MPTGHASPLSGKGILGSSSIPSNKVKFDSSEAPDAHEIEDINRFEHSFSHPSTSINNNKNNLHQEADTNTKIVNDS